ncbi:bifunctional acetate--CoA ligase family protein/GNAT family N-acetyltransferase [uncultured Desulfosarcina sp.]|uniref:bifunctional acetate--CoA ligase family protein/GNAT family N-acetyltransferase n=1 Tax=uncultured Desulfosarcina sp. TaxID=218289 RepID=UPI0029C8564D|nr:bifunctional acetate--CoA ligase family protein/GNAT family N-acetyltransferase [uncultured Desulfosarcina sp.]
MSVRNLESLFNPSSVVLVGASATPQTVGAVATRNLFAAGFLGDIYLVNPRRSEIEGHPCFKDVASLPEAPDLAVIATPPDSVPGVISQLGERGTKAAVVITAGFGEGGSARGKALCDAMLEAAHPHMMRIVGPNCFGLMLPRSDLNASFIHLQPLPGRLAFVAQSGALLATVVDWATHRRIGFSHLVSLGDMADVDFGDTLDYLSADSHTRAILLYIESITHARKFMSAVRAAARVKPVIVVKAGRYRESATAAASHTGAMAGSDAVYEAAFKRAGILRVNDLEALFDAVSTLGLMQPVAGDRLAIVTNGGGIGVMATDTLMYKQGTLARFSEATMESLNQILPRTWSHGNPVDVIGDATPQRYVDALTAIMDDRGVDAVLAMNCPTAIGSSTATARAVLDAIKARSSYARRCGLLTCWIGEGPGEAARKMFIEQGIPSYETPTKAVRGFMQMVRYRHSQDMLMEVPANIPEAFSPDRKAVRDLIETVLAQGRDWLLETEAKAMLGAYGIDVVPTATAETPEEAADIASGMTGPYVLKVLSKDILHKSDAGGVALDLETPGAVAERAAWMKERFGATAANGSTLQFSIQPMIEKTHAHELIVGMHVDPQFGPVLLFGHGGTGTEIIGDRCLALPPLNMKLAREMIDGTRISRLLAGYRGVPGADLEEIAAALLKVSQLVCDFAEIVELDINPLLADPQGVLALDARIRIQRADGPANRRLAICPYPVELEQTIRLPDGQQLLLRPIRPEDEPAFQRLFASLPLETIRLRFLHVMKMLPKALVCRLTQIDYDREMALVLTEGDGRTDGDLYGIVRFSADPDIEKAEFAILLGNEKTGLGLGPMLMRRIIDYARSRGIRRLFGEVLSDNRSMLALCKALGFSRRSVPGDPGVMEVTLDL